MIQKTLTQNDRTKLFKKLAFMSIFIVAAISIFTFIYTKVLRGFTSSSDGFGYIPLVMFGIFGLFFAGIIGFISWAYIFDLKNGVKNCIEGVIDDKMLDVKHTSSMRSGAGKSGRQTSTKRSYFIIIDETKYEIEQGMYASVHAGDDVYFEVAPKSNVILCYEVLEKVVQHSTRQITRYRRGNYPDSKIRQTALTPQDRDILKGIQKLQMKSRLRTVAFLGLPIFGMLFSGLGSLLVFVFPLPLLFIFLLYKLLRLYLKYKKSATLQRKHLVTTQVVDKSFTTITRNGNARQKCKLKTTYKSILVSEMIYEKVKAGDEVTLHEIQDISLVLGISINKEYFAML